MLENKDSIQQYISDLLFQNIEKDTKRVDDWIFKGTICEVIREKDFDPFAEENFVKFDLSTAMHEIG